MNREQKAAFVEDVAQRLGDAEAVFAVDYRGITVSQTAALRGKLNEADATFQVVKNTLTRLALDKAGNEDLKEFLEGPTAFTYVKGDVAAAAKAIADFAKEHELLTYKGGLMDGQVVTTEQFQALTKLPSRDVLNGRLVGMIASPLSGLVRSLNGLIGGLAIQLGQIAEQGLVPAAGSAAAPADTPAEEAPAAEADAPAEETPAEETPAEASAEEPAAEEPAAEDPAAEAPADEPAAAADEAPADEPAAPEADEAPADEEAPAADAGESAEETGDDAVGGG